MFLNKLFPICHYLNYIRPRRVTKTVIFGKKSFFERGSKAFLTNLFEVCCVLMPFFHADNLFLTLFDALCRC